MKIENKKLYILIAVLAVVLIFSLASICNQCSITQSLNTDKVTTVNITEKETDVDTSSTTLQSSTNAQESSVTSDATEKIIYTNTQYGFSFALPGSWEGYSIILSEWDGNPPGSVTVIEKGPIISIRNPRWSQEDPYQDIPIMVFTISQWNSLQNEEYHIGAAPIGPTELGRNQNYVFALPARYNYSYLNGWEEVEKILGESPLKAI